MDKLSSMMRGFDELESLSPDGPIVLDLSPASWLGRHGNFDRDHDARFGIAPQVVLDQHGQRVDPRLKANRRSGQHVGQPLERPPGIVGIVDIGEIPPESIARDRPVVEFGIADPAEGQELARPDRDGYGYRYSDVNALCGFHVDNDWRLYGVWLDGYRRYWRHLYHLSFVITDHHS